MHYGVPLVDRIRHFRDSLYASEYVEVSWFKWISDSLHGLAKTILLAFIQCGNRVVESLGVNIQYIRDMCGTMGDGLHCHYNIEAPATRSRTSAYFCTVGTVADPFPLHTRPVFYVVYLSSFVRLILWACEYSGLSILVTDSNIKWRVREGECRRCFDGSSCVWDANTGLRSLRSLRMPLASHRACNLRVGIGFGIAEPMYATCGS